MRKALDKKTDSGIADVKGKLKVYPQTNRLVGSSAQVLRIVEIWKFGVTETAGGLSLDNTPIASPNARPNRPLLKAALVPDRISLLRVAKSQSFTVNDFIRPFSSRAGREMVDIGLGNWSTKRPRQRSLEMIPLMLINRGRRS